MVEQKEKTSRLIFYAQVASISLIWIFVSGVTWWILTLIRVAIKLQDMPDASVGISIVVIPIFIMLASTLTYVFIGLQRNQVDKKIEHKSESLE